MTLNPEYLRIVIETFSKRLKHPNAQMRMKAAQCLGNIGNESIIPFLCQALEEESNLDVQFCIMDAMIAINRSTPQSVMSETSQSNKYNIVQPQNVQIIEQGDGIIHNYATPQNLAEAAQEIQQLISQLTQTYPTNTEVEKQTFVAQVDAEIKKNSRLRSILITGGIELIKILCPPLGIPIEMGKKWLENANLSE
ncbi:MAG: HEAT repeat domain-containing protein [Microcystis aeruginosa]